MIVQAVINRVQVTVIGHFAIVLQLKIETTIAVSGVDEAPVLRHAYKKIRVPLRHPAQRKINNSLRWSAIDGGAELGDPRYGIERRRRRWWRRRGGWGGTRIDRHFPRFYRSFGRKPMQLFLHRNK